MGKTTREELGLLKMLDGDRRSIDELVDTLKEAYHFVLAWSELYGGSDRASLVRLRDIIQKYDPGWK